MRTHHGIWRSIHFSCDQRGKKHNTKKPINQSITENSNSKMNVIDSNRLALERNNEKIE